MGFVELFWGLSNYAGIAIVAGMKTTAKIDVERVRIKTGRPPLHEEPMKQIAIRLPDHLLEAIDVIIEEREGAPDRAAIIRELIARGLRSMS